MMSRVSTSQQRLPLGRLLRIPAIALLVLLLTAGCVVSQGPDFYALGKAAGRELAAQGNVKYVGIECGKAYDRDTGMNPLQGGAPWEQFLQGCQEGLAE